MSSRTPEECVELVLDESVTESERVDAIHELKMANECDELDTLVQRGSLSDGLRQRALQALATPQCEAMLRRIAGEESLEPSLRQEAENILHERDDQ